MTLANQLSSIVLVLFLKTGFGAMSRYPMGSYFFQIARLILIVTASLAFVTQQAVTMAEEYSTHNDPMTEVGVNNLRSTVHQLSNEAFSLAKQAAQGTDDAQERERKARDIDRQLDNLLPQIQASPANEQAILIQVWNDARLDTSYILSGGTMPTSTRLSNYLEDVRQGVEHNDQFK